VTFRLGTVIVAMDVSGPNPIPQDALAELADMQVVCLDVGECLEPVALPASLVEVLA
jgi:hypothetical protein